LEGQLSGRSGSEVALKEDVQSTVFWVLNSSTVVGFGAEGVMSAAPLNLVRWNQITSAETRQVIDGVQRVTTTTWGTSKFGLHVEIQ